MKRNVSVCFLTTGEESLDVIQIAHKYQMMNVVGICQKVLNAWILDCTPKGYLIDDENADSLLRIITLANRIEMNDLLRNAIQMLAKYSPDKYKLFQGNKGNKLYTSLPVQAKHDILLARLTLVDDKQIRN